ncbi:high affinity glucose transporter [Sporothrix eucalyptigena]
MLIVGRFINGLCVGICSSQVPVYVSELSPPHRRGLVVGTQQWAITWGVLIMFYISYGCSFLEGTKAFRIPWGVQMVPALIMCVGLFFLPESPRWLARQDRWEECHQILGAIHGHGDLDNSFVQMELQQLNEVCALERDQANVSYFDLFRPKVIWRTHIGMFVQIWSQLTGINVIMYYITFVFSMAGLSGNANLVASSISYVINVVMTIPALLYVDRIGRRRLLILGSVSLTFWWLLCAGLMGKYGSPAPPGGVNNIAEESWTITGKPAKVVIACSYLVVASFAPTWGPVSWIYPPELMPLGLRGKAASLSTSSNWIFNFALSYFTPVAFVNIKWKTYLMFGIFGIGMTAHVFFCFPETKGKTLEEIEKLFANSTSSPWKMAMGGFRSIDSDKADSVQAVKSEQEPPLHVENSNKESGNTSTVDAV